MKNNWGQISIELTDKYIIVNDKVNVPIYKIRKIQNLKNFIFIDFKEGALPINKINQESIDDLNNFMTVLKSRISKKELLYKI